MDYKKLVFLNMIGNTVYLFALWVLTVIVTKIIGYEGAGIFTLAMSIGNVFFQFQVYGMQTFQVSDVSGEYKISQYFYSRYVTVAIGVVGCLTYCLAASYDWEKTSTIICFLLFKSCEAISLVYFAELQKIGHLEVLAKSLLTKSGLMILIFSCVLLVTKRLMLALLSIFVLAMIISFCYDRVKCLAMIAIPKEKVRIRDVGKLLHRCFPLMIAGLVPIIITALPRITLDRYNGEELLGYYGNISAPTVLITAIVPTIMYPVLTWYGQQVQMKNWKKLANGLVASVSAFIVLGIIASGVVYVFGDVVMSFVFTDEIVPYIHYMYPLIAVTTMNACIACVNYVLIAVRENKLVMSFSVISLLAACMCSANFVKRFAISGAIAVLGVAYFVQLTLLVISIIRFLRKKKLEPCA